MYYPWDIISGMYEKIKQGAKRLDYESSRYKISVYHLGDESKVRIDLTDLRLKE